MRTSNLTILFASIPDFAERTARQTLEENQRLARTRTSLILPLFRGLGGRVVKSLGDGYLVTFDSPTQAVLSAVAVQDRLWEHNREAPEPERLALRMAINVGEVRLQGGDVFGEPVNIAARVLGVAEPGEVYFTEAVHLAMNKAEVPAEVVGGFQLKGIPGEVRVFRVSHAPYRLEAPAPVESSGTDGHPFGMLGLSRVPAGVRALSPDELAATATELGMRAAGAGRSIVDAVLRRTGRPVVALVAVALAAALALALAWWAARGSEAERAVRAVEGAPPSEKDALRERAEELISRVKEEGEREYLQGKLHEALGEPLRAAGSYRVAASAGERAGEKRLVELLEHPECRVRVAAAQAAGELRLDRARGALEELAEHGGLNEGLDIPLIGCNSKRAAEDALRRLDR